MTKTNPVELVQRYRLIYAYKFASRFAYRKVVLDVGCGAGYGVYELSKVAQLAVGIDISREKIIFSHLKYGDNASFIVASALNLPFRKCSFYIVTSFQVIEHINPKMVNTYLNEIKYVLKDDGMFILSTPNKRLRLLPLQKPWNPEHWKEYDEKELRRILKPVFPNIKIYGLSATKTIYMTEYNRVKQNPFKIYIIQPLANIISKLHLPIIIVSLLKASYLRITRAYLSKLKSKEVSNLNFRDIVLENFYFTRENLKSCLDFYAVCKK